MYICTIHDSTIHFNATFLIEHFVAKQLLFKALKHLMKTVWVWGKHPKIWRRFFWKSLSQLIHISQGQLIDQPSTLLPVPVAWHLYANRSTALCPSKTLGQFKSNMDRITTYSLFAFNHVVGITVKTDFRREHLKVSANTAAKHCLGLMNVQTWMQLLSCSRNSSFTDNVLLRNMLQDFFSCYIQSWAQVIILVLALRK